MLHFILADLRRNWIGAALVVLLVTLATALGVAVTLQERALRLGSARAAAPFDLLVGAAGSETQLVLSSVFLQAAPLPLMTAEVLARLRADPRAQAAAPVGFGDFIESHPVVGTTPEAIGMLGGLTEGDGFERLGDAVAGADVARRLGSHFRPFHGTAGGQGAVHGQAEYRISGRLARTGTPWDRAILVPIQSVWHLHADHGHGDDHDHAHDDNNDHPEEAGFDSLTSDHAALLDAGNPGVPAIIVKPRSIADAYQLRQEYRAGQTMAVFPAEVLTRLYGTLGDARRVLSAVAVGAQILVAAAILMVIATHVLQRRRQIGALRAFGAPRMAIMTIVCTEVFLVIATGLLGGFAVGYGAALLLSRQIGEASGVALPVGFTPADFWMLAAFLLAAALTTLVPASIAWRQTPAEALRG